MFVEFGDPESSVTVLSIIDKVPVEKAHTKKFLGRDFTISYPSSFIIRPMKLSDPEASDLTDEAYFKSPDGNVEFYVYAAPLRASHSLTYSEVAANEVLLDDNIKKSSVDNVYRDYIMAGLVTLKAKDNSYYRYYYIWRGCHTNETSTFIN